MKSQSLSQSHFAHVPGPQIQRSKFDRSSSFKGDFDAGLLIPFFVDEALPGDTFQGKVNIFGRLNTPIKPIMDNIFMDIHFFSVPNRLVWTNWKKFMGERTPDPDSSVDFLIPELDTTARAFAPFTPADYMGLPTNITGLQNISALPLRAMTLIWNEWYRDENLQNSLQLPLGDGPDSSDLYSILPKRGKRKDYFTSALPWPQKGAPVTLPLGGTAPVTGTITKNAQKLSFLYADTAGDKAVNLKGSNTAGATTATLNYVSTITGTIPNANTNTNVFVDSPSSSGYTHSLSADLSSATAATINQLRQAFQLQRMYERDARGGTRYTELIRSHFGVTSPDARLQRPEYLGGGTLNVNVNPIAQTSATEDSATPQGNLSAMGTFSSGGSIGFTKSFTEHEIIIGFISARANMAYQQGINKMWLRQTRNDFYWPTFAHLGEQAILNKEIYAQGSANLAQDEQVFGYQERYAEYRYKPGVITGSFRSNYPQSLDVWHLAQEFENKPSLNSGFIQENPPIKRIVAVPSEKDFLADIYTELYCTRPMPTYSTPGLIDHF